MLGVQGKRYIRHLCACADYSHLVNVTHQLKWSPILTRAHECLVFTEHLRDKLETHIPTHTHVHMTQSTAGMLTPA